MKKVTNFIRPLQVKGVASIKNKAVISKSDNYLDTPFRKAVKEYRPKFDPADWDNMNNQLNQQMKKPDKLNK